MRVRRLLVATGTAVALSTASAVPAQAHILTCANTRLAALTELHDRAETLAQQAHIHVFNIRLGVCHQGLGSKLRGVYHRHTVTWTVTWWLNVPTTPGQFVSETCTGATRDFSPRLGVHYWDTGALAGTAKCHLGRT